MNGTPLLQCEAVAKSYAGVPVLREVGFSLGAGKTLGLVGENGAGKSTLMNILAGSVMPDGGRLVWEGAPYAPRQPGDATRAGIAHIHQELNLFPNLDIAENLFLTAMPRWMGSPVVHRRQLRTHAAALLAQVGLALPPETMVERLSAGERQLVEIARALGAGARLIILDEPTTSLSARESARLFQLLGELRSRGVAMIYISHALEDVLRVSDDLLVLRDGVVVGSGPRSSFGLDELVALMVGRSLGQRYPVRAGQPGTDVLLQADALTQRGMVRDLRFRLHRGEVLGIFGLMGAGRSELMRILFGLDPCEKGSVRMAGRVLDRSGPRFRVGEGMALVTEDRRLDGLCLGASIAENLALVSLRRHARGPLGWLDPGRLALAVAGVRSAVHLTPTAHDQQSAQTLSGGNQQKVVLAKWLLNQPRVFILDEPTRGIDVGAKYEIYQLILRLADEGAGIILVSSELEELTALCDRILVMSHGEFRDEVARPGFDRERILRAALRDAGVGEEGKEP